VTYSAIHTPVAAWLKRHLRRLATARAAGAIHLARLVDANPPAPSARDIPLPAIGLLVCGAALRAAARGIGQSPAFVKFLLAGGKRKGLLAVAARQGLIGKWHVFSSLPGLAQLNTLYRAVRRKELL